MKKLLTCFFALIVVAPAAIAADGAISRALPTSDTTAATTNSASRSTVARTATRTPTNSTDGPLATTNVVRSTVSRIFSGASPSDTATTNASVARTNIITRAVSTNKNSDNVARSNLDAAVNTVGRNSRVSSASINSNPAVRRAGLTLRPSTAEVGGRATIGDDNVQTGSNIDEVVRGVQSRAATTATRESIADATERLEQTATLNKSCQQQYNDCMDQFCAVIDANQGRCSCSSNLSRYTKVENAVKDANTQLNEVAQRIRYVGLSADEIRAIMNETEAEEVLSGAVDTSETRNMLEKIEDLIRDPVSNMSYSSDTYGGLDLDLNFSSEAADLFSLDFLNTNSTGSFSNLRGADLYNAAKRRCNSVLTQCKSAGATAQQITGNYDLAIDKDCIAYEKGLTKMNETLVSNVRSANLMLQKARLAVLQNKNQYDAKGCIAALNTCMTDDMVCGDDYFKCVDPTKRYIDENGEVVLGQDISLITAFMTSYNNATITNEFVEDAYQNQKMTPDECNKAPSRGKDTKMGGNDGSCVAAYLMHKIGTKQAVTDEGLCRAVLDKCQRYTYDANGKYKPWNDVVVNYVQRAMVNIRAAQQQIISDYASTCMVDIATCYNQQVTQVNAWSSSASIESIRNVMRGACRNVALTCAYAVFDADTTNDGCPSGTGGQETCIDNISDMFYQSLLCPDNSTYQTQKYSGEVGNDTAYVNAHCMCNKGYTAWGSSCLVNCPENSKRNNYGTCVCNSGLKMVNGTCQSAN